MAGATSLVWLFTATLLLVGSAQAATGTTTVYLHEDALGSVVGVSDESGELIWQGTYAPYGEPTADGEQSLSYTGHVYDMDSGLVYMGARYYDPQIGRFLARDPVGYRPSEPLSFNPYVYANNNPYRFTDPNGETPEEVLVAFANSVAPLMAFAVGTLTGDQALVNVAVEVLDAAQVDNAIALASVFAPPGTGKAAKLARKVHMCSFSPETWVATPAGEVRIDSLSIGDTVLAKNDRTGDVSVRQLTDAYSHWHDDLRLIETTDAQGGTNGIHTTDEHPFYVEGKGWVRADHLAVGDELVSLQGVELQVSANQVEAGEGLMYNLTVAEDHTFAVTDAWVWVHNACDISKRLNGNSKASTREQHLYMIQDADGNIKKVGVSGLPLNKNGTSGRANSQLKSGDKATVLDSGIPGRANVLEQEKQLVRGLRSAGHPLPQNQRPK